MNRRLIALALSLLASSLMAKDWLVDDFNSAVPRSGPWMLNHDNNNLGTVLHPDPFAPENGSAHIWGHAGLNQAPWTWAQLQLALDAKHAPVDLSGYASIRFKVKGDGNPQMLRLIKNSITDSDHYLYVFPTTEKWTEIRIPLSAFKQAGWGKAMPRSFGDVISVEFGPAAHDADFDIAVDDVTFSTDEVELKPIAYDSARWFAYEGIDIAKRKGTALDASGILDAPAGKYGWVKARGEDFVFEKSAKAVKFFGVNLVAGANFPTHEQAEQLAENLAQLGVNITRRHHADAPWASHNFFGKGASTRKLDAESMDRFDYLTWQLEKRGIYQYLDMLVHRKPLAADGVKDPGNVVNGFKIIGEFAPDLIALQREFIAQLLKHKNPYSGRSYGEDPGVAMMEIINEDSLFYRSLDGDFSVKGSVYPAEFKRQYNAWLRSKIGDRARLALRWAANKVEEQGLGDDEDPGKGTVETVETWQNDEWKKYSAARVRDNFRFYYDLQDSYLKAMQKHIRALGFKGPVTGSNHWLAHPADLAMNAQFGYIDRHAYWAHPQGGWGYNTAISWDTSPMVKSSGAGIIGELGGRRVKGLPYIVTEWQIAAPNDYRQDAVLFMGAYGSLQNWSAIQFAFSHTDEMDMQHWAGKLDSNFDISLQPGMLALWPAVSRMLQRHDLKESALGAWKRFSPAEIMDPSTANAAPARSVLALKRGIDLGPGSSDDIEAAVSSHSQDGWIRSDGGELRHHAGKGQMIIDSPCSQGFSGFGASESVSTSSVVLKLDNAYATVLLSSLDGQPIAVSKRMLLATAGNAINTGQLKSSGGNQLAEAGTAPVLVEPIEGTVHIAGRLREAWALNSSGERVSAVPIVHDATGSSIRMDASYKTLHYELLR